MTKAPSIQDYINHFQLAEHLNADLLRCLHLYKLEAEHDLELDDPALARLYFLVAGSVYVSYNHLDGTRSSIGTLTPLELIGELDLFVKDPNLRLSITTAEPCTFLYIERDFALRYGVNDPRFLRLVIQNLSSKLIRSTLILRHNVLPLNGQVAALLLTQSAHDNKLRFQSKNYLAELVGTTTRHLNRILNSFVADGLIVVEDHIIEIRDRQALMHIAKF
jgi:CRP/FNR family transcriptional regulator, putaive post-exponential-phase nitrogen-starvation regulator